MKSLILSAVAMTALLGGCASRETMRELQTPSHAASAKLLFPTSNEFRDAVVLEWIGGMSQHSYVLAEPNQAVLRPAIVKALRDTGLLASTPVRARYGLRVIVSDIDGPNLFSSASTAFKADYVIVERATGREVFKTSTDATGSARLLAFYEGDLRRSTQRSLALLRIVNSGLAAAAFSDLALGAESRIVGHGGIADMTEYDQWTQDDWLEFAELYRYSTIAALVYGPARLAAEMGNPLNYVPLASDRAIERAARDKSYGVDQARADRNASARAARANQRATDASVTQFLLAFAQDQKVTPIPILPCYGSPAVEAAKKQLVLQGIGYTTDDCTYRR